MVSSGYLGILGIIMTLFFLAMLTAGIVILVRSLRKKTGKKAGGIAAGIILIVCSLSVLYYAAVVFLLNGID